MIDPVDITKFNQTTEELEEVLLFWVLAAGKNAMTAARSLERFLNGSKKPFKKILKKTNLALSMKSCGIGCSSAKSRTFIELAKSQLDLNTCTVDELEGIWGIGPKTARCFLIHSREDARHAGLDVHVLHYLRDLGYEVPKQTPTGQKYKDIEKIFLDLVDQAGKTVHEMDLEIWTKYSGRA